MKKRFEIDKKDDWYCNRWMFYSAAINDKTISIEDREFCERMEGKVIYESPKTYVDGIAYNDGSWVIYETFRTNKGGKLIGNFRIKDLNDLIRRLYGYMVFLKLAGISNKKMLVYFTVVFFDRLVYQKGMFDCNWKNKDILNKLADRVLCKSNDELTKGWTRGKDKNKKGCWDDRKFCLDTSGMSKSEVSKKRNEVLGKKQKLDDQIEELYEDGKSIKEMLDILHRNGVKIGKSRYCLWLKEHKGAVQNRPSDDNGRLSKTDHSNEGEAVQNRPSNSENGCPEQDITIHNIDRNSIGIANPMVEKEKRRTAGEQYLSYCTEEEQRMIKQHLEIDKRSKVIEDDYIDLF